MVFGYYVEIRLIHVNMRCIFSFNISTTIQTERGKSKKRGLELNKKYMRGGGEWKGNIKKDGIQNI